jgi:hypothetical protein
MDGVDILAKPMHKLMTLIYSKKKVLNNGFFQNHTSFEKHRPDKR